MNTSAERTQIGEVLLGAAARRLCGLYLLLGTAAWAGAQPYPAQPDTTCKDKLLAYRADSSVAKRLSLAACTNQADSMMRSLALSRTSAEASRLVKMFFDVPEYHDEGRLFAGTDAHGPVLGPFAGIYASPFLQGFTRPAQIFEQGPRGTLAAIVIVETAYGETIPDTYKKLFLESGMNCVWLAVEQPSARGPRARDPAYLAHLKYHAFVARASGTPETCDRRVEAHELPVVASKIKNFSVDSAYLPVARFDTDNRGNLVLGFRCLNAFCEVGPSAPAAVRTPDNLMRDAGTDVSWHNVPPKPEKQERREVVKAWHDEQTLAIRDNEFIWRPSRVRATIVPETDAATADSADFVGRWLGVAVIKIRGQVPKDSKYYNWGLVEGDYQVQFRNDPGDNVRPWKARIAHWDELAHVWRPVKEWLHMKRTVHFDVSVPPVVRFRWTYADDGVWAPCGNACCQAAGQ